MTLPGTNHRYPNVCACGEHAFLTLTRGYVALISPADIPLVDGRLWQINAFGYAVTARKAATDGEGPPTVYMARVIAGSKPGQYVDHRNHDRTDNRRDNLRICTNAENLRNRRSHRNTSSPFKGVSAVHNGTWNARIAVDGVIKSLGCYRDPADAARAYDEAALRLHGEFARTNEMLGLLPGRSDVNTPLNHSEHRA